MKSKNVLMLLFFVLAALVVASLISELIAGVPWLQWLTRGAEVSFGNLAGNNAPLVNFSIIQLNFGLHMQINLIHILCILGALILHKKLR